VFPPVVGLTVVRVPRMPLRLRAHVTGSPTHRGLIMWASPLQQGLGGQSVVVESPLSWMVSCQAPVDRCRPEPS
jgi:hypothetical protein